MQDKKEKKDIRIIKTYMALTNALYALIRRRSFDKITVNDLCEEALISRAAFYTHFSDKYDLLKFWMMNLKKDLINDVYNYKEIERVVNQFIRDNSIVLLNILQDSNDEVRELVHEFMYSVIDIQIIKKKDGKPDNNQIILANFCAAGLTRLLMLQVNHRFTSEYQMINPYIYEMLGCITEWDAKQR